MKIVDFRFRPNTPEIIEGIKNSSMFKASCEAIGFNKRVAQPLPEIVEALHERDVQLAVITGRDCEVTYGFPANNANVLEFVRACPDLFAGFWGVDPHKGMKAVHEIVKAVEEYGMCGISTDPYLAHIPPHDARYYPLYSKCCELNIPVVITTAPPPEVPRAAMCYITPSQVDIVARDFPELKIVMSHGGYPYVNEAIFTCMRNANVYMDLSEYEQAPMADVYVQALNTTIGDKVVFASAHPFVEQESAIKIYEEMPISDETREKVMFSNAMKILGRTV